MVLLSHRDMTQSDHEMQGNPDREAGTESRSTGFHPHGSTPPTEYAEYATMQAVAQSSHIVGKCYSFIKISEIRKFCVIFGNPAYRSGGSLFYRIRTQIMGQIERIWAGARQVTYTSSLILRMRDDDERFSRIERAARLPTCGPQFCGSLRDPQIESSARFAREGPTGGQGKGIISDSPKSIP